MMEDRNTSGVMQQQLVCSTILIMPVVYMVVAVVLRSAGVLPERGFGDFDANMTLIMTAVFLMVGVSSAVLSMFVKGIVLRGSSGGAPAAQTRFKSVLVAMAVSEAGAVMGLVLVLLTGNILYASLLCGLSFAVTCFHFPGRRWLEYGDAPD